MPDTILGRPRDILGEDQGKKQTKISALVEPYILVRGRGNIKHKKWVTHVAYEKLISSIGGKSIAKIKEIQMRFGLRQCIWNVY